MKGSIISNKDTKNERAIKMLSLQNKYSEEMKNKSKRNVLDKKRSSNNSNFTNQEIKTPTT